METYFEG
jgi:hypothetical protein